MIFPMISSLIEPSSSAGPLAFLDGIGSMELLLVFVLALVLFGGKGLPNIARGLGRAVREFKKATSGVEEEIKRAMETPSTPAKPRAAVRKRVPARRPAAALPPAPEQKQAASDPITSPPPASESANEPRQSA